MADPDSSSYHHHFREHKAYANEVAEALKSHEIRVLVDDGDDTVGKKIRNHRKLQPAYMAIVGDGEAEGRTVSLRARNGDQISGMGLEEFITALRDEIDSKVAQPSIVVVESDD